METIKSLLSWQVTIQEKDYHFVYSDVQAQKHIIYLPKLREWEKIEIETSYARCVLAETVHPFLSTLSYKIVNNLDETSVFAHYVMSRWYADAIVYRFFPDETKTYLTILLNHLEKYANKYKHITKSKLIASLIFAETKKYLNSKISVPEDLQKYVSIILSYDPTYATFEFALKMINEFVLFNK